MKFKTNRDKHINYSKKIYFDDQEHSWIVTDQQTVKEISKNELFSSNRLAIKFKNSNLPKVLDENLRNFYNSWMMYQDGEIHKNYRKITQNLLSQMMRQLDEKMVLEKISQALVLSDSRKEDIAQKIEDFCKDVMALLFGVPKEDYLNLLSHAKPITKIMYSNTLSDSDIQEALKAIYEVEDELSRLSGKLTNDSLLKQAITSPEIPTGLIVNLLIDGEDPLESFMKSIGFLWASTGLTDYSTDMMKILSQWAPFTSISRVCLEDASILNENIKAGDRVLGILSMSFDKQVKDSKPMAFGEGIAMRISRLFYAYLSKLDTVYLDSFKTNDSFGYFAFTEIIIAKRVIVFDLDGTLCFNGVQISPSIIKSLLQLNEKNKLIFASARPIRDMLPLLDAFPFNDLIGGNGSIVRSNCEIIATKSLDKITVKLITEFIQQNNLEYVIDYEWDYSAKVSSENSIMNKLDIRHKAQNIPIKNGNVIKIILFHITPDLLKRIPLEEEIVSLYHEDTQELVITASGIDKYQILQQFIGKKKFTAFGNDKNDYYLLKNADSSVVVGDNPEIATLSDIHLKPDETEIVKFLNKIS